VSKKKTSEKFITPTLVVKASKLGALFFDQGANYNVRVKFIGPLLLIWSRDKDNA
jgi:hypothetical protein